MNMSEVPSKTWKDSTRTPKQSTASVLIVYNRSAASIVVEKGMVMLV